MNLKDQILQKTCLEEVVERYLPLRRNGSSAKTLVGLCPFHDDRHPSLLVNVKGQYYKCFACGEGGDLFRFVQKMEDCDFRGALKKLAGWYGLSEAEEDYQPMKYPPVKKKPQPLPEALVSPLQIECLLRNHRMMLDLLEEYIPENEILRETYKTFEVGIAPAFLPRDYTYLSSRLVFPIRNERGDLVAFAGRYRGETVGTDIRKYMNSSNSAIYHKSEILYGLYQAQEEIRKHGFVYITEGYKDVLAMHAAGFRNTVALCGTVLTEQHITLLGRYTHCVIVMLDGDEAGRTNGYKSARLLAGKGFSAGRIILEPGQDPDSLLGWLGGEEFIGYIRKTTRFSRLEIYETDLLKQIKHLLADLSMALTVVERSDIFSQMIPLHKRLGKVTTQLTHSPVLKAMWLINTINENECNS
ncbi:CHC2 zinc finger domain-containing protein [uncultured Parabacteroides sp.]|uniref:DNA primase n=1 Tax=uncultured Parabacteroides sp. TaxID=512312 RepID=UPI0025D40D24|nr:CHC2 zinc finger domain-containing protein [uncultured Parabacteroides sp.]